METPNNVVELPNQQTMVCPKCGIDSACQCGVAPITRAEYAVLMHPELSDRAIAEKIGVNRRTVTKVRKKQLVRDTPGGKRVGRDGKSYKQPVPKAPKSIGWIDAVEQAYGGELPKGFARRTMNDNGGKNGQKAVIEAAWGRPIPPRLIPGCVEAREIAEIIRGLSISRNPETVIEQYPDTAKGITDQVPLNKREQFDKLIEKAKQVEFQRLKALFVAEVEKKVTEKLGTERAELDARRKQMDHEEHEFRLEQQAKNATHHRDITPLLTQADFRLIRMCLHTDRIEHLRGKIDDAWLDKEIDRLQRAAAIWNRLESRIDWKVGLQLLRERGWAAARVHKEFVAAMDKKFGPGKNK